MLWKNLYPGSSRCSLPSLFENARPVGAWPVYCRFSWGSVFTGSASFWKAFEETMWIDISQSGTACGQLGSRHFSFSSGQSGPTPDQESFQWTHKRKQKSQQLQYIKFINKVWKQNDQPWNTSRLDVATMEPTEEQEMTQPKITRSNLWRATNKIC